MLAKRNRIIKSNFKKIFRKGSRIHTKDFSLVFFYDKSVKHPRFAIITSKKIGNACTRNKIKRRIRTIIQELLTLYPLATIKVIVHTRPSISNLNYKQLAEKLRIELKELLKKASIK